MKKRIHFLLFFILSLPKTLYFNFRSLPFHQAVKLPVIIGYRIKILETHKGIIELPNETKFAMVRIGWGGSEGVMPRSSGAIMLEGGKVVFKGFAGFSKGCSIRSSGYLEFGDHFSANVNCFISCSKKVVFGSRCMLGWEVNVRDSDGHTVYIDGKAKESQREVIIGNHVWLCSTANVLKGSCLGDNSIAAYGCLLTRSFPEAGLLVGGAPAVILQRKINWGPFQTPKMEK